MPCLYCGKEIGPLQILRDSEFCTSAHRKQYRERLGKALRRLSEPEPAPLAHAGFIVAMPWQEGETQKRACSWEFAHAPSPVQFSGRPALGILQDPNPPEETAGGEADSAARVEKPSPAAPVQKAPPAARVRKAPPAAAVQKAPAAPPVQKAPPAAPVEAVPPAARALPFGNKEIDTAARPSAAPEIPAKTEVRLPVALPGVARAVPPSAQNGRSTLPSARMLPLTELAAAQLEPTGFSPGWALADVRGIAQLPSLPPSLSFVPEPPPEPALRISQAVVSCTFEAIPARAVEMPALAIAAAEAPQGGFISEPVSAVAKQEPEAEEEPEATPAIASVLPLRRPRPVESLFPERPEVQFAEFPVPVTAAVQGELSPIPADLPEETAEAESSVPGEPDMVALDYHCQRSPVTLSRRVEWRNYAIVLELPEMTLEPIFDRLEELLPPKAAARRQPLAVVLPIVRLASKHVRDRAFRTTVKALAAGLLLFALLWFGKSTINIGRQIVAANRVTLDAVPANAVASAAPVPKKAPPQSKGPVAWAKRAVARRAAVQLTETFAKGMTEWGSAPKHYLDSWSYHPEGYVQPGRLALYGPSMSFTDYRLEFFGMIENKGMNWVMRARDPQNYYAMKVSVVQPGLRQIIAIEHYPVVGGKKGHSTTTPLNVMVHRNTPILVAVAVKGNQFVASVEGQQVDMWRDDTPEVGGVGFFSEAGARARLYWMQISKNQDFLGRICAYLTGDAAPSTAWMRRPETPWPAPAEPRPDSRGAALASAGWRASKPGPQPTAMQTRRIDIWIC